MEWCRVHGTAFIEHAAEIGLSEAEAQAFIAETQAARTRLLEQAAAQEAAKVATQRAVDAIAKLEKAAGRMVAKVRAFAGTAESPTAVYAAAQIAPPATPSPQKPPAQPTRLAVTLNASVGALALSWKARNPAGTSGTAYIIRRRLPGEDAFTFVGISGVKAFVDETLPVGVESVQYTVQGQRANSTGPVSSILTVNFGKPSGESAAVVASAPAANVVARSMNANAAAVSMRNSAAGVRSNVVVMPASAARVMPGANMGATVLDPCRVPIGIGIPQEVVAFNVRIASPPAKRRKRWAAVSAR